MGKTSDKAPIPSYFKLQMYLLNGIETGKWAPEAVIPPERKLAERFGVSLGTAKRAIMNLVGDGYLYRIQGKGTFVSGTYIPKTSVRYTRLRTEFKDADPIFTIKWIGLEIVEATQPIKRYLRIRAPQRVYRLERLFLEKNRPIFLHISFLPEKIFPDLGQLPTAFFEQTTLYEAIEKRYGLPTIRNQELFGVSTATETIADALEIAPGQPVLTIEMLSFTYKNKPYEYRISHCRGQDRKVFREM